MKHEKNLEILRTSILVHLVFPMFETLKKYKGQRDFLPHFGLNIVYSQL